MALLNHFATKFTGSERSKHLSGSSLLVPRWEGLSEELPAFLRTELHMTFRAWLWALLNTIQILASADEQFLPHERH